MKKKIVFSLFVIIVLFTITGCGKEKYDGPTYLKCYRSYSSSFQGNQEETVEFYFTEDGKSREKVVEEIVYDKEYSSKKEHYDDIVEECDKYTDDWKCKVSYNAEGRIVKKVTYKRTDEMSYEEQAEIYDDWDCESK